MFRILQKDIRHLIGITGPGKVETRDTRCLLIDFLELVTARRNYVASETLVQPVHYMHVQRAATQHSVDSYLESCCSTSTLSLQLRMLILSEYIVSASSQDSSA